MSFAQRILKSRADTLCLIIAPVSDGRLAWYFVRVDPAKFEKFKTVVFYEATNLATYGEVIRRGYGEYPPQSVLDAMRQEQGFNPEE
jgi:hypothetical protein